MSERKFNFSAGPAVLPLPVLENVKKNLLNYNDSGIGVMEMSHRGADFTAIIEETEALFRELLSISDDYEVIFTTGGASTQFSAVPMNLLGAGQTADYILTGSWAKKAAKEAKKFGEVSIAGSSEDRNFRYLPEKLTLSENAAYLHFTSNNTIAGTQYKIEPEAGNVPLICDASSDFLHKKLDVSKYGLIYAGAQKNLGPAGVTIVIVRKDLLSRIPDGLPVMLDYRTYTEAKSLYNTPPTFPIYVVLEVLRWAMGLGGLDAMYQRNTEKAALLYDAIEKSKMFKCPVDENSRSLMNVVFRIPGNEELETQFIKEATAKGLDGLKGHRSVGGMRASIYNAFPREGVEALVSFMSDFEAANS